MESNSTWQFATASNIKFGRGCRNQIIEQLSRWGLERPIVVTDPVLCALPLIDSLLEQLRQEHPHSVVFDGCQAEPSVEIAEAACSTARSGSVDCVISIGGGSNLDVGKIVATVTKHGGGPRDYFGFDRVPGPVLPHFAMPTTAGTGSEVSHSAVLTDVQQATKVSTLSAWLRPLCALVDPALTDSCPRTVTAHSGIDALVHAIEAYTNRDFTEMVGVDPQARAYEGSYPLTKLLAAEAIRLIGRSLVIACNHPNDATVRDNMALAATYAGMAFSNSGVGIVHALEYPIGALTHIGHGEGNGLLLPHVMRFNLPVRMTEFADIARWLGVDVAGLSLRACAQAAIESIEELQGLIGIRQRLSEVGLRRESIPDVAAKAFEVKRLIDVNPKTLKLSDLEAILEQAF